MAINKQTMHLWYVAQIRVMLGEISDALSEELKKMSNKALKELYQLIRLKQG
jgi:Ni,Fe-hydrogenase maturation factor